MCTFGYNSGVGYKSTLDIDCLKHNKNNLKHIYGH